MKTIEMKRTLSILCLLSFSLFMNGQQATGYTKTRNYTAERTYMDASSQTGSGGARIVSDIVYTDCFGRKEQEIQVGGSPGGNADLVLSYTYNMMGQVEKEYLPYAKTGNNGAFDKFSPERWSVYGTGEQAYAYNLTQYEDSPLMRVSRKMGPGKAWHTSDKSVRVTYGMNSTNEVRCYKVSSSGSLIASGFYGAGKLEVIVETDEDGHRSKTYTDSNERTLLTVSVNGEDSLATYYVYDDRNCLRYVLPPEASHRLAEAGTTDISVLHSLAYSYEYDKLNRMISKRLPGCAPIYMVYDRRDRLVLSQDGTRRTADTKKWSYFLYDSHDRVIESGEILLSAEQTCGELQLAAWENEHYLPSGTRTPLQYTVYDNYKPTENVTAHPFVAAVGYDTPYTLYPSGLTTSTKTRLLGTDDWLTETIYYDDRSRVIQTLCHYPEKGLRYRHTAYDFTGNVLRKQDNIGTDILETVYTYDDRARLLTKANTWNGRFTDKITYVYDALGRLTGRNYGDKVSESLSYNIRGWLTGIESQHFSQTLHYVDGVGVPCYNGNISSMIWHSGSEAGLRGYKFTYDGFSRLKDAIYGEGEQLSNNLNRFNEQVTGYDKNGNILGLLRYGQTNTMSYGLIDNLNLVYNGNQLESVNDNATGHVFGNGMEFKDGASKEIEYEYDVNGNLTKDLNKKIADIQYNCLNLPEKVQFEGGNSISYLYAADGTKLRTTYKTGNATTITDYCGNAIYENGVLIKVLTEDGYITVSNNQFHYFIQDHQGNNRVVVAQNGTVEEVNDYYPFGGLLSSSLSNNVQPYKYNGKELNRDNGLDWYDYGARMYDASLGRWHAVDPSGEKYPALGLYAYCKNSPIIRIDPDGKDDYVVNANGAVYLMRKTDRIVDVLYASGINSSQKATQPDPNWKSIRVFDKSMLQGLTASKGEKGRDYWDRKLYTTTNSVYNAANVFLFVADNTSVEWTLKGGYMDGKRTFILGTNNNRNRVSSMYGLTKVQEALFPTFIPIIDIHSHPYNPFASPEDMDNARLLRDIRYGIYYKDNIINYTDQNNSTYSIKVNSMNDLMRYIFQQLR
ncbi:DUF6443 domain-containing protein [Bacteroides thetaiotaomicron]|uniref:DUF6443 domain-containing protein n=1 Tax=Bacteroides thetaiotaomicron TaxID=818 RepID=UPI0028F45A09|nr:JAB-like toxin 1 domain-containing protein [Bacteroides thetaiotaomicron]WOG18083.1 JAB-like toxin 1 domain-containing protein [Bacteroides thetaiotaomicron]